MFFQVDDVQGGGGLDLWMQMWRVTRKGGKRAKINFFWPIFIIFLKNTIKIGKKIVMSLQEFNISAEPANLGTGIYE